MTAKNLTFGVISKKFKRRKFPHDEVKIRVKRGKKEIGVITMKIGILGLIVDL